MKTSTNILSRIKEITIIAVMSYAAGLFVFALFAVLCNQFETLFSKEDILICGNGIGSGIAFGMIVYSILLNKK
jgi:positive regulator of sigma E activity